MLQDVTKICEYEQQIHEQKRQLETIVKNLQEQKELLEATVKLLQSEMQLKMASEGAKPAFTRTILKQEKAYGRYVQQNPRTEE